jgi:hypothetical protein
MANKILAGAVVNAGAVIAGVDADNPPVASAPSLGDPFPHAGDMKSTAPSPLLFHQAIAGDWMTYGVSTDQPYGESGGKPIVTDEGHGALLFIRYDLGAEMLYGLVYYHRDGSYGETLEAIGFGEVETSGSFWEYHSNVSLFHKGFPEKMLVIKRSMTEAEFDALEFYWDADGGQFGQGSWRINPDIVNPYPS